MLLLLYMLTATVIHIQALYRSDEFSSVMGKHLLCYMLYISIIVPQIRLCRTRQMQYGFDAACDVGHPCASSLMATVVPSD